MNLFNLITKVTPKNSFLLFLELNGFYKNFEGDE